jgi:hypothetical protein
MIKSEMRMLSGRENANVTDADVTVCWKLQPAIETMVGKRREKIDVT